MSRFRLKSVFNVMCQGFLAPLGSLIAACSSSVKRLMEAAERDSRLGFSF